MESEFLAGRYQLLDTIGRGGMGTVWRAWDHALGRTVAIKELRLPDGIAAGEAANFFTRVEREARAAARLRHPGIVTVHDRLHGADGRPWIVMEYIQGGSLADVLAERGRLEVAAVAAIGAAVLGSLRLAHDAGVVHRDIKPANVLLEGDRAVLTDFGIAAVEGDATLTQSGTLLGTPAFMAPEQVRGLDATPRTDLWALGATLYAAVEGRAPFTGNNAGSVFLAIATEALTPPVHAGPLAPVLTGLLQKDPAARMSAQEAHDRLAALAGRVDQVVTRPAPPLPPLVSTPAPAPPTRQGVAEPAPAPTAAPDGRSGTGRDGRTILLSALAAAAVALLVAGLWQLRSDPPGPEDKASLNTPDTVAPSSPSASAPTPTSTPTGTSMDPVAIESVYTKYMTGLVTHDMKTLKAGTCPRFRHRLIGFALNGMYVTSWKLSKPIDLPPQANQVVLDAEITLRNPSTGKSAGRVRNQWIVERDSNGEYWTCGWLNAKDPSHP